MVAMPQPCERQHFTVAEVAGFGIALEQISPARARWATLRGGCTQTLLTQV